MFVLEGATTVTANGGGGEMSIWREADCGAHWFGSDRERERERERELESCKRMMDHQ